MKLPAMTRGVFSRFALPVIVLLAGVSLMIMFAPQATAQQQAVTVVSAATFASDNTVAPNSIGAAFGQFSTQSGAIFVAGTVPLPTTLGGVSATVNGVAAQLLFVAPGQINFVIPGATANGQATIVVTGSDNSTKSGTFTVVRTQPGIFMVNVSLRSAAAQTTTDGVNYQFTSNADGTLRDVNAGTVQNPNFLVLYLTGLRNAQADNPNDANGVAEGITVTFLGVPGEVTYAGPAPGFTGLDQINVRIPPELAGLGTINVRVKINSNGQESNTVTIRLGGQIPPTVANPINPNEVVAGALTFADQVQVAGDNVYFFDAFAFQTTGNNVSVAIDLRSPAPGGSPTAPVFDPTLFLFKVVGNDLQLLAIDDQSGGIGTPNFFSSGTQCTLDPYDNNNSLILTVIPDPGLYVVVVTSSDFNPLGVGSYTLLVKPNVHTPLTYGQTVQGNLETTDIRTSAGTYLDVYAFNGVQGDRITATMTSTIGSFLLLQSNDGETLEFSDSNCALPGNTATLTFQLPESGTYLLYAYSPTLNTTGAYSLSLQRQQGLAPEQAGNTNGEVRGRRTLYDPREQNNTLNLDLRGTRFERAARRRFVRPQ
jgi:uncharacterized protein (TIGR03437 family)